MICTGMISVCKDKRSIIFLKFWYRILSQPEQRQVLSSDDYAKLQECNMLFESSPPEGFHLNDEAIREIRRIAEAGHMKPNFSVLQPAFFHLKREEQNTFNFPAVLPGQIKPETRHQFGSFGNYPSSTSSSVASSTRSVDSNISQNSWSGVQPIRYRVISCKNIPFFWA